MKWTTDIEDHIDAIRDEIYEEIREMSSSERTAYFNAAAEEARKQGFRVVSSPKADIPPSEKRTETA